MQDRAAQQIKPLSNFYTQGNQARVIIITDREAQPVFE
jgi:hypothetical protein